MKINELSNILTESTEIEDLKNKIIIIRESRQDTLASIQQDVYAAKRKGYTHNDLAFTTVTVQALINKIVELKLENDKLLEIATQKWVDKHKAIVSLLGPLLGDNSDFT